MLYLMFLIGLLTGIIITRILVVVRKAKGTLLIDRSDPETDRYRFVIEDKTLQTLHTKKRVELKINPNANLSDAELTSSVMEP